LPLKPVVFAASVIIKLLFLIPSLVFFAEMNTDIRILISVCLFDFLFVFFSFYKLNFISLQLKFNQQIFILILIFVVLLVPVIYTLGVEINLQLFLLKDIYHTRLEVRNVESRFITYCVNWSSKIIIPIIIVYGFMFKKKIISIIGILSLLLIFLISGAHKSILISLFIILFFYLFNNYYKKTFVFVLLISVLMIFGMILYDFFSFITLEDLLVRRTFFDPSLMDVMYFDFFDNNQMNLSHSIFKYFVNNSYDLQPSYVIGSNYFHNSLNNAGSGIIGDGFMNFGMFGALLSVLFSVFILCFITSSGLNSKFFGIIFIIIYGYTCTGILTNILTGGVFLIIILIQYFLKNKNYTQISSI